MATDFHKPDPLKLEGNLKENFRRFKQEVDIYFTVMDNKDEKVENKKLSGLAIYEKNRLNEVLEAFENYCVQKKK